jgi:hypothetical protein
MRWEKDGKISYLMHYGHTEWLISLPSACHPISLSTEIHVIYGLSLSIEPTRPSSNGTWISSWLEETEKSNLQSWRNGGKRPTIVLRSAKIEPKDGMIKVSSPKNSR